MSSTRARTWDVMIVNFDGHLPLLPASFQPGRGPLPMGSPEIVRRRVDEALAEVDWSDPARGRITVGRTAEVMLEIELGHTAQLDRFVIHVHSPSGAGALICHLCLVQNWAAFDCARGVYLDLMEPAAFDAACHASPRRSA
jgi:hypothetical protein